MGDVRRTGERYEGGETDTPGGGEERVRAREGGGEERDRPREEGGQERDQGREAEGREIDRGREAERREIDRGRQSGATSGRRLVQRQREVRTKSGGGGERGWGDGGCETWWATSPKIGDRRRSGRGKGVCVLGGRGVRPGGLCRRRRPAR